MNCKAVRDAAAGALAVALTLGPVGAAHAEKPPVDPVEKRFQSLEKQLKQLREIVLQAKDTGQPVQVRIGILNQLSPEQISEIVSRFADAMLGMGAEFDKAKVMNGLKSYYAKAA